MRLILTDRSGLEVVVVAVMMVDERNETKRRINGNIDKINYLPRKRGDLPHLCVRQVWAKNRIALE